MLSVRLYGHVYVGEKTQDTTIYMRRTAKRKMNKELVVIVSLRSDYTLPARYLNKRIDQDGMAHGKCGPNIRKKALFNTCTVMS